MKQYKLEKEQAVKGARLLMESLGIDLSDPNYTNTPERMVKVLTEFTGALRGESDGEISKSFQTTFPKHSDRSSSYKGMIVQSPIRIYSLCSHHLLPVIYDIAFAYIPTKNNQIGFSKIVRVIRSIARRPMNQEDFTQEIVDTFFEKLNPEGLAVVVSGTHLCMSMRGVVCDAINKTSSVKGDFKEHESTKNEFLSLAGNMRKPF